MPGSISISDPTDMEPTSFLAKQAIRSVARLASVAADAGRTWQRNRQLQEFLDAPTFIEELSPYEDDLRTGDASAIVEFLAGDEVERLLQWVAALQVTDKWDEEAEGTLQGRLSGGILRYTKHVSVDTARAVAAHVAREMLARVSEALGASGALDPDITPKAKRVLVKNATLVSRVSLVQSSVLNDLDSKSAQDGYVDAILRSVQQATTKSKMPHLGNLKSVPVADLYVAPNAELHQRTSDESQMAQGDIIFAGRQFHRLVILGDPGGGKTTTSRRMMNIFSTHQLQRRTDRSLALMVVLRDWAEELASGQMTVVEVLRRVSATRHSIEPPENVLEALLDTGRIKVFFDGLDELLDTANRNRVVEVVEGFVHRFPLVPVVVTSRRVGYPQAPLDGDLFNVVEISSFDAKQRREYVRKWFFFEEDLTGEERAQRVRSFVQETDGLLDIASNPLMLSLMCALYSYDQYIPRNRPEVYEKCSRLMFDSWDRNRGIRPTLSFQSHMMGALDALALYMYQDGLNEAGLTRALLVKRLAKYLKKRRFRTIEEARDAAANFVDHCSGRAWILSEVSPERYTFTHATFIEYFAARQLTREAKSPKALAAVMRDRVLAAEWDVVCQLAVQIIGETKVDGSDKVIRTLLSGPTETWFSEANVLSFALRCFEFYVPSPRTLDLVADRVVALHIDQPPEHFEEQGFPMPEVFSVGAEVQAEWLRGLFDRIATLDPTGVPDSLRALVVAPPNTLHRPGDQARVAWRKLAEPISEEWRIAGVPRHLWCVLAGPTNRAAIDMAVRNHGVASLFTDGHVGQNHYQLALASRILAVPNEVGANVYEAFTDAVMTALQDGPLSPPQPPPVGFGLHRPAEKRCDVISSSREQRTAIFVAGMGILELVGEVRGESRERLVPLIFSGGGASLEGGSLLAVSQLDLRPDVQVFANRWVKSDAHLFSSLLT